MQKAKTRFSIQTVSGMIDAEDLGVVLPHEHLFFDFRNYFVEPDNPHDRKVAHQPLSLRNLSWVRSHKETSLDNLYQSEEQTAISEVKRFRKAGGGTIVDVTPNNAGRNPQSLLRVAKTTELNIIMGTAYYIEQSYSPSLNMNSRSEEDIAEEFIRDIVLGVDDTGVCAGIIGELGCSWPLTDNERKVLRAGAIAQRRTGAAISIHPGPHEDAPFEIMEVLTGAGADPSRIIIGHMHGTIAFHTTRYKLAQYGCYLQWDAFGQDGFYPPYLPTTVDIPSDSGCVRQIIQMIAEGYLNRILISQDVFMKANLTRFGGFGYSHILENVIPLMREKGITEEQIHAMMVENPRRVLSSITPLG